MTPAQILSFERGFLRRADETGDPELVLHAIERVVAVDPSPVLLTEAAEAFYNIFWVAAEDISLNERLGVLDARLRHVRVRVERLRYVAR